MSDDDKVIDLTVESVASGKESESDDSIVYDDDEIENITGASESEEEEFDLDELVLYVTFENCNFYFS